VGPCAFAVVGAAAFARRGRAGAGRGPVVWTFATVTSRGRPRRSGRVAGRLPSTLCGSRFGLAFVFDPLSAMADSV
jgi:hypothetical protein